MTPLFRKVFTLVFGISLICKTGFCNFQDIESLTANYLAFCENELDYYRSSPNFEEVQKAIPSNLEAYKAKVQYAKNQYRKFNEVREILLPFNPFELNRLNKILKDELLSRFRLIAETSKWAREYTEKTSHAKVGDMIVSFYHPTFPETIKSLSVDSPQYRATMLALTDFQFRGRLIKELTKMIPPGYFSEDVKVLLQSSVSLHSFLRENRKTLDFLSRDFCFDRGELKVKEITIIT